ncbi:MAG: DNA gyrase inhibitor YacG [Bradyrhizobiaceae bacterium]|nr:DNA gyrase inhibitor YacG [Bradyrhizobiaceae bacterium]
MRNRGQSLIAKSCPICGKPVEQQFRPFCSRRCADVDLHRWLSGAYTVPVVETEDLPEGEANERAEGSSG